VSHELEKAESRLDNVRKVKPILAALRTISLGSWQLARNRRAGLASYSQRLADVLPVVLTHAARQGRSNRVRGSGRPARSGAVSSEQEGASRAEVLVIGSERGLCGRYNKVLLEQLRSHLAGQTVGSDVAIAALGSRLDRDLRVAGYTPVWTKPTSITALPSFGLASDLVTDWLCRYEAYELDVVDVVYNVDKGAGTYEPSVTRLIPPELPRRDARRHLAVAPALPADEVIVATDAARLYVQIVEQWTAVTMYGLLLEGALTEHSARYQLMESATQNAGGLEDELILVVQSARRQSITREMQELAIGAGLLADHVS